MVIQERRSSERLSKNYQVFCRTDRTSAIGETYDITEKGVGIFADLDIEPGQSVEVRIVPRDEIFFFTCDGKVRHHTPVKAISSYKYRMGIEFNEGLKDFATEQLIGGEEDIDARSSLIINAPRQVCYDSICNYESYPQWQKFIKSVVVHERDSSGRPSVVEFSMDALIKSIRFVNKYEYFDKDFILSWKSIDGDIKLNEGSYVFQRLRDDRTNAIFTNRVELGFYVPRRLLTYFTTVATRNSIKALKEVSESGRLAGRPR